MGSVCCNSSEGINTEMVVKYWIRSELCHSSEGGFCFFVRTLEEIHKQKRYRFPYFYSLSACEKMLTDQEPSAREWTEMLQLFYHYKGKRFIPGILENKSEPRWILRKYHRKEFVLFKDADFSSLEKNLNLPGNDRKSDDVYFDLHLKAQKKYRYRNYPGVLLTYDLKDFSCFVVVDGIHRLRALVRSGGQEMYFYTAVFASLTDLLTARCSDDSQKRFNFIV